MQPFLVPIQDETDLQGTFSGYPNLEKIITFSLVLRPKNIHDNDLYIINSLLTDHPANRNYLNHHETANYTSYSEEDRMAVIDYFNTFNFTSSENRILREITFTGKIKNFESAFHCKVGEYTLSDGQGIISVINSIYLPSDLAFMVYDFDGFEQRLKKENRKKTPKASEEDNGWERGYNISDIMSAYTFPKDLSGSGQCIGIVELGGEYNNSDLDLFFKKIGIKKPQIEIVGTPPGLDTEINNGEVSMDLQILGAIAPEAKLVIYYARTFIEALKLIINDDVHKPSVVSISWSAPEEYYNETEKREFDQLFYQASLLGISIVGSSGDHGAFNNLDHPNVPLPACHPLVLSCGGTTINIKNGMILGEMVWNEFDGGEVSGGGFSDFYSIPDYQFEAIQNYNYIVPNGRGVPDVAALSSTIDGFQVILDGVEAVVGGTSTATPLWSGLIALINESLGYRLGFINTLLYRMANTNAFNPITQGHNLLYQSAPFWNPCTGLGTPDGTEIIRLIKQMKNI